MHLLKHFTNLQLVTIFLPVNFFKILDWIQVQPIEDYQKV